MKRQIALSLIALLGFAGVTQARTVDTPVPATTHVQYADAPTYVYGLTRPLMFAEAHYMESNGFHTIGFPVYGFVPELGTNGWMWAIAPDVD